MKLKYAIIALTALCAVSCYDDYVGDYDKIACGFACSSAVLERVPHSVGIAGLTFAAIFYHIHTSHVKLSEHDSVIVDGGEYRQEAEIRHGNEALIAVLHMQERVTPA